MEYVTLGRSGIRVSRLCLGSLTVGPLQANLPIEEGAGVMAYAFSRGINFTDTAQYYRNYAYLRRAMQISGKYDVVISTKTYAYTRQMAMDALEEARRALDRDVIDIFMLHEQESIHTLRGHMEALDYLLEMRERGVIRAVGASTHRISGVRGVCEIAEEPYCRTLDVVHPLFNRAGLGIADGTADEMLTAIRAAHARGIGIFSMKALGGGNLLADAAAAFDYVLGCDAVDAVAVGMQSYDEVDANITYFETGRFPEEQYRRLASRKRRLLIEEECEGCGACVSRCRQGALSISEGHAICESDRCLLCGYCAGVCPQFAIKVI